jgi:hypothetical protein
LVLSPEIKITNPLETPWGGFSRRGMKTDTPSTVVVANFPKGPFSTTAGKANLGVSSGEMGAGISRGFVPFPIFNIRGALGWSSSHVKIPGGPATAICRHGKRGREGGSHSQSLEAGRTRKA